MPDDHSILKMPVGFLWGAATAAHQNEGDNNNNQWAAWESQPGHIVGGQRCGKANNWWDLEEAAEDFDRAAGLGLNTLRLSVEWSRIEPEEGSFDKAALRKYGEMMDLLRQRGIEPMLTLHHFTDPLWLTRQGAWENPRIVEYFARFVARTVEALGDRIRLWCTVNEPFVYAYEGFMHGVFPPGAKSMRRAALVLRRMLLAHGRAYRLIHTLQNNASVGLAHNQRVMLPANPDNPRDVRAAALLDQLANGTTLKAIMEGRLMPVVGRGEIVPSLVESCDYIGLNYYSTARVAFDPRRPTELFTRSSYEGEVSETTMLGEPYGEINPHGLYLALMRLAPYKKPIYIAENGVPDATDQVRPRFIVTHLAEAWRAIQEGVDLRGFYHWTLVDNFEWCEAYRLKFGLFEMDQETRARTPKTSAAVYSRIAQSNGIPRSLMEQVAPGVVKQYFKD